MSDNDDILARFAAGEGEHGPPPPHVDDEDPNREAPGTDGPDDSADADVDPDEPNRPGRS